MLLPLHQLSNDSVTHTWDISGSHAWYWEQPGERNDRQNK